VRAFGLGGGGRFGSRFFLHLEGSGSAIVDGCDGGWWSGGDGVEEERNGKEMK
jgi:hypothetical protein